MKTCVECSTSSSRQFIHGRCYNCYRRHRYNSVPEVRTRVKAQRKEYLNRRPEARLATTLKQYGLTVDGYKSRLADQGNCCAICKSESTGSARTQRLCVDHDHQTGKVRGLLCASCNRALGLFKDSATVLETATRYIRNEYRS